MSQVVTELVIDSNTSGADQFSQAMDKAGNSAQQGVGSVAGLTLAVAGVGVAFVGALAGLRAFVDYVGNTNKQLVDIAENSRNAGFSVREFQETLFAARSSGVSEKDFISGLDRIGADLTAASRGVTEFGKLFESNGLSIKNANGELKNTKAALVDIAGLMQKATPDIQQGVAKIVGLTKDWVPFLRQGADAIEAQKKAAADLGVVIDDSVIQKSKEFDKQWKTAIATWDLQFKASLSSIMPLLVKMATLASTIIEGVGSAGSSVSRWVTPDDEKTKSQLNDQINDVARLAEMMEKLGASAGELQKLKVTNLKGLVGLPEDAEIDKVFALIDKLTALYDKKPARVEISGGTTVLPPSGGDANDQVDRAINTLKRHTEQQLADTRAVGLGADAHARFRAEAALNSAVMANGGKATEEQKAQFEGLAKAAGAAADALARAKIANDIRFSRDTSLLSPADVQIATQLRDIYPNVATALDSAQAAQIRFNNAVKEGSTAFQSAAGPALLDFETGAKKGSDAIKDFETQFVRSLLNMINQMLIFAPLAKGLQGVISGGIDISGFGFNPIAGVSGHHAGGIVGSEPTFTRYIHPAYFDDASRFHSGGIAGDEVPIIAKRGEGVFTQGQMAAMGGGGGTNVTFNVIEDSSRAGQREQRQTGNGGLDITQFVDAITAKNVGNPGSVTSQTLDNRKRITAR